MFILALGDLEGVRLGSDDRHWPLRHRSGGIVCFITVAGFLNGPGFERMRDDLRRNLFEYLGRRLLAGGHQPDVPMRIFEGVQQPVCIVLAGSQARQGGRQAGAGLFPGSSGGAP
jgi:hypothetical protein